MAGVAAASPGPGWVQRPQRRRLARVGTAAVVVRLAQILLFLQLIIPVFFERYSSNIGAGRLAFPSPFRKPAFTFSGVVFSQDALVALIVVPAVLLALVLFFRTSWIGVGIRGAAQ